MTEPEHSPTPWVYNKWTKTTIETKDGRNVCSTGGFQDSANSKQAHDENLANAAFIVTAVNSHEKLVSLIRRMKPYLAFGLARAGKILSEEVDQALAESGEAEGEADDASK